MGSPARKLVETALLEDGLSHIATADEIATPLDVTEPNTHDKAVGPLFAKNVEPASYFSQSDDDAPALKKFPETVTMVPPEMVPSAGATEVMYGDH